MYRGLGETPVSLRMATFILIMGGVPGTQTVSMNTSSQRF
jgi:hypothetical protein